MNLAVNKIAKHVNGEVRGMFDESLHITSISIDTRNIVPGALFIPIKGARVDGHDLFDDAVANGAVCVLSERDARINDETVLIRVESTRKALMDLARYYLSLHTVKVIGITGSAGKTTTKDMIHAVLSGKYKTKKTMGNYNNDIGMPLSIFQLDRDDEIIVLEMGMNHAGEIHRLSLVGKPDIAVITNIGDAHIENLGSREGILHAKLELIDALKPGGSLFLNGDDPLLTGSIAASKIGAIQTFYPNSEHIIATESFGLMGTRCHFRYMGEDIHVTIPVPGRHMVANALMAVAVAKALDLRADEITQGFDSFTPPKGRLNVINANDMVIVSDVYNASPAAVKEAINTLFSDPSDISRKVLVLGDMAELGDFSEARHREIGSHAAKEGINLLIAIGSGSMDTMEEFTKQNKNAIHFKTKEDFIEKWQDILKPKDTVLIKAARSMAFEHVVDAVVS